MKLQFIAIVAALLVSACGVNTPIPTATLPPTVPVMDQPTVAPAASDTPVATQVEPTSTTEPTSAPETANLTDEQKAAAQALLDSVCAVCHSPNKVNSVQADQEEWVKIITRMQQKGAVITDPEILLLAQYLTE